MTMNDFAWPLMLMLVLVMADVLVLKFWSKETPPWRDVVFNLNSGHVMLWWFRGLEVAGYAWLSQHASLGFLDHWPAWAVWAFSFVAWDFCFYWEHRLHHAWSPLWAVHVVHHEGEHFNLSLGVRNSWFSSATSLPFFAALAMLGVPLAVFVAVSGVHYSIQFWNHCGSMRRRSLLDRWFVTPINHRVHHGANQEYRDKNFGGTLRIWDRLFGTWQDELADVPIRFGVDGAVESHDPVRANLAPVWRWLSGRDWPKRGGEPVAAASPSWVALGGLALFAVVIYYVHAEGHWPPGQQALLFGLTWSCTVALGALSQGREWGRAAWSALAVGTPMLFIGALGLDDPPGVAAMAALGLHGAASLAVVRYRATSDRGSW